MSNEQFKLEVDTGKRFSVFDYVNRRLSVEDVIRIAGLKLAADKKSHICPACGHGSHGDGIRIQTEHSNRTHGYCFGACGGIDYSAADLICMSADVNIEDPAACAEYLVGLFPEWKGTNSVSFTGIEPARSSCDDEKDVGGSKDYAKMYRWLEWQKPLSSWLKIGERWRGLTYEVLRPTAAPYHKAIYHPELWLNDKRPAMLFPYDNNQSKSPAQAGDAFQSCGRGFFWRSLVDGRRGYSAGFKFAPYVASTIKVGSGAINFLLEGQVDSLSLLQAVKDTTGSYEWLRDVGILAVGSANYADRFISWVVDNYGAAAVKPRFFVVADNDEAGMKSARKIVKALNAKGFVVMMSPFTSPDNPKLDANDVLQEYGAKRLFDALLKWKAKAEMRHGNE